MFDWIRNQSGSKLNLSKAFFSLANNILCRVALGKRFGNNGDLVDVLTETNVLISGFWIGDFFPRLEVGQLGEWDKEEETMRLHPPAPLLAPREYMDKCILDVYEIPAKTRVVINAFAIGRDPKSWEDPLHQEFKFVPFGGGRRGCPGFAFGLATIEIALARLLYHFDWELPPEVLGPHDVDLDEIFGLASRKKSTLVLVPKTNKDFPVVHIESNCPMGNNDENGFRFHH
ncbi:hypothetical protein FEM48_Zijuj11G0153700 [Ziziphus jujuba var. spinosa]|uniref:Cytochrome P450 71A1-like n=1 Tax=Ziziphus jujuba var. spinosa TaxID=714518 RepID=A0A978UJQ7_ZIZJJ|nr:hypothetical protein FEM48_Zijuj11G0153700 [Ziziphus jujuba var. spinosa]